MLRIIDSALPGSSHLKLFIDSAIPFGVNISDISRLPSSDNICKRARAALTLMASSLSSSVNLILLSDKRFVSLVRRALKVSITRAVLSGTKRRDSRYGIPASVVVSECRSEGGKSGLYDFSPELTLLHQLQCALKDTKDPVGVKFCIRRSTSERSRYIGCQSFSRKNKAA